MSEERRGGGRLEAGGFVTDRHMVLWGMSNGPTGAGKPTQRQLRVKDKIFDKLFPTLAVLTGFDGEAVEMSVELEFLKNDCIFGLCFGKDILNEFYTAKR